MVAKRHHFMPVLSGNVCGILWVLLAGLLFSIMVASIRYLGSRFPSYEIVFFRSSIQLLFLTGVFLRIGLHQLRTTRPVLQCIRSLLAVILINCNFYAFTKLPIADVTAIGFSRNLFLVVLAYLVLDEKINIHRLIATMIGFLGIIIIVRPGSSTFQAAAWIALAGAGLGATMMTLIRKLTATDSNFVMMIFPALAITLFTLVPTAMNWVTPHGYEFALIVLMSASGVAGQWCLIQGFRRGEATAVAPASYVRMLFASIIGFYLFDEIPDSIMLLGTVIIIGSNLYLILREGRAPKTAHGDRVPGDVT